KAYDAAGNSASSPCNFAAVSNMSSDTTPPNVSLTAPNSGSTASGTVTLSASASDNVGVTKVDFYCDRTVVGTRTAAPFSVAWNSAPAGNGSHGFSAKAYDAAGNWM